MRYMNPGKLFIRLFLVLALALSSVIARAETFVGTNLDSRVIVGFSVNAEGMQPFLPAGWSPVPFPAGPLKGANLMLGMIDRALQLDPEGKPASPSTSRHAVLAGLGKQDGGDAVRLYVYRIYASDPGPNPYGNSVAAVITRSWSLTGPANEGRLSKDAWTATLPDGGELALALSYTTGHRSWSASEANPYSNTVDGFSRIYRYEQLTDLVASVPLGKPLAGAFDYSSSIPELAAMFDGSEELVAILDVPVYVRKVYLPE